MFFVFWCFHMDPIVGHDFFEFLVVLSCFLGRFSVFLYFFVGFRVVAWF